LILEVYIERKRVADCGVIAGKTGTTEKAGQCLMLVVREGSRKYIVVLLGSEGRYADMRLVIDTLHTNDAERE
jgi:D-alanyl-D-alanine carboxypeptidase